MMMVLMSHGDGDDDDGDDRDDGGDDEVDGLMMLIWI